MIYKKVCSMRFFYQVESEDCCAILGYDVNKSDPGMAKRFLKLDQNLMIVFVIKKARHRGWRQGKF